MYNYIDREFNLFGIDVKDNDFYLYKNEQLVLKGNMKPLKELGLPVRPFEYNGCYILLDYYKGVKIYKNNIEYFFKLTSIFDVGTINNYIIFFGQKKIHIMDIDTLQIIKEMNRSENLDFCKNDNYALFYRFKNNKSYLVDLVNNTTIQLNNFIKEDVIIHKICIKNDNLYVLVSEKSILKVIKYNFTSLTIKTIDVIGKGSANGAHYYYCFEMIVKDENLIIDKETVNYIEFICYIFKKYGLFIALYVIDNEKIYEYDNTKYKSIVDALHNLIIKLNRSKNIIDSMSKLKKLKIEINKLQDIIEKEISKLDIF